MNDFDFDALADSIGKGVTGGPAVDVRRGPPPEGGRPTVEPDRASDAVSESVADATTEADVKELLRGADLALRLALGLPTPEGADLDLSDPEDRLDLAARWCTPAAKKYLGKLEGSPEIMAGAGLLVLAAPLLAAAPIGGDDDAADLEAAFTDEEGGDDG